MTTPEEVLSQYFGYSTFRLNQKKIIHSILEKKDVLAILPTGGGKSVCYQVPGLLLPGVTIVISPLISLMKDQVDQLKKRHISAAFLNSTLSEQEAEAFFQQLKSGELKFAYIAPERLTTSKFLNACLELQISLIAVDEAHCVSQWGHDFRPSYLEIHQFIKQLPIRPVLMALTATATPNVQQEIISFTGLHQPQIYINSFKRTNLTLVIKLCLHETERNLWLLRLWKKYHGQKVLLYCATRYQTHYYAVMASHFGYTCQSYHAGLSAEERNAVQQAFTEGKVQMVAATNAFGMGIDIPDIRLVIHLQLPQNIEGYYQEIGRAGRDGLESACYLFHTQHDQKVAESVFRKNFPQPTPLSKKIAMQRKAVKKLVSSRTCHSQHILQYFGETHPEPCLKCEMCKPQLIQIPNEELEARKDVWAAQKKSLKATSFSSHFKGYFSPTVTKYVTLFQPTLLQDWLKIPGVGKGFIFPKIDTMSPA